MLSCVVAHLGLGGRVCRMLTGAPVVCWVVLGRAPVGRAPVGGAGWCDAIGLHSIASYCIAGIDNMIDMPTAEYADGPMNISWVISSTPQS